MMGQKALDDANPAIEPSVKDLFDQLIWWSAALKVARAKT